MLTSIQVVPPPEALYAPLTLPVIDAGPDEPIFVRDVQGLEPVDALINTQGYGPIDGEFYAGSRLDKRNIVLTLGLNDVEVSRPVIYSYFKPKGAITLKFTMDGYPYQPVYISGYVEKTPSNRFTPDPEVQISIICPKPKFLSEFKTETGEAGIDPDPVEFIYDGTEDAGFQLTLETGFVEGSYSGDVIVEVKNTAIALDYRHVKLEGLSLGANGELVVVTQQGFKRIEFNDQFGDTEKLLGRMSDDSFWIQLWQGTNLFRVRTPESDVPRDWTLIYTENYGGI